ncbi:MAG TPA: aminopeptidase P family protein [Dehalococcoidia bacterium]|jgi:Xaa-Pro dipeptidase|nr:aminopeptidase P family protein [Dehalococcoidia bacterium]|tara:strand:- start:846 stop:1997 length:1152 start_codon:yes stop_codon:yes gene_type:complete
MPLHFTEDELTDRRNKVAAEMQSRGLDALLIFRQESMYYLTGYDTTGYSQFQCLYMSAGGTLILLTRSADLRQAHLTSVIEDVRIWVDSTDSNPGLDLRQILEEQGCRGKNLGVELEAWCLTGRRWEFVKAGLDGFCTHEDASTLVSQMRIIKSPAELEYVRRAAALADEALVEAHSLATPGRPEQEILAAMESAIFRGGGDYPASRFIIGSGAQALNVRNFTGYADLGNNDQLQLEFGGTFRHYHSCLMRTILTGKPDPRHLSMHSAAVEALEACKEACRPGATFGGIFDAHAKALDGAGFGEHKLNACGYSLGALYPPTWMDWPMIYAGNPVVVEPNMVIFMHMILLDWDRHLAMAFGDTVVVTPTGSETLTKMGTGLTVN